MLKHILLIILVGLAPLSYAKQGAKLQLDNASGHLKGISNKSSRKVTVKTSESTHNGQFIELTDGSKPEIQNVTFDIKNIKSMNLIAPWQDWSGDATIHITTYDNNGNPYSQADITDRNDEVHIHSYLVSNPSSPLSDQTVSKKKGKSFSDVSFNVEVKSNGSVMVKK